MKRVVSIVALLAAFACVAACRRQPDYEPLPPPPVVAVKEAEVAGKFYPADKDELAKNVGVYLGAAKVEADGGDVVALFVPHAGYDYSGAVAAAAYAQLGKRQPATFVILAPSHRISAPGIAAPCVGAFGTPLGDAEVDRVLINTLQRDCADVRIDDDPFGRGEHAVEVQLPFIQTIAPEAKIAPFIFTGQTPEAAARFGEALGAAIRRGGHNAVIICTCDLSHYHPYEDARRLDAAFVEAYKTLDADAVFAGDAAGTFEIDAPGPTAAALAAARALGGTKALPLVQINSGDVTGDKTSGVVGYFAGAITK